MIKNKNLLPRDGEVFYYHDVFCDSCEILKKLEHEIEWRQDEITLYGKTHPLPRLQAFYGDSGLTYTYSHIKLHAVFWTPTLKKMLNIVSQYGHVYFNCVLLNFYRTGQDYVSWHSDSEPEFGKNPVIASASFGSTRSFHFKHKIDKNLKTVKINLEDNSLLIMRGECQDKWNHQLAKTSKACGPRINLTFRKIV